MQEFRNKLAVTPKRIFLIDGFGAFLTAFILFVILKGFYESFAMPKGTLDLLSIVAIVFSGYSFCCLLFVNQSWRPFLQAIIIANFLYCCLTMGFVIYHYPRLTILGVTYFLIEIAIVCGLACFEISIMNTGRKKQNKDQS